MSHAYLLICGAITLELSGAQKVDSEPVSRSEQPDTASAPTTCYAPSVDAPPSNDDCTCGAAKYGLPHIDHFTAAANLSRLLLAIPKRRDGNKGMWKDHFALIFDNGTEICVPWEEGLVIADALHELPPPSKEWSAVAAD